MPKPIKLKNVIKTLEERGFFSVSQRGSHKKFRKESKQTLNVIVKITENEIPYGTFKSILSQSKLKEEDFRKKKK